MELSLPVKKQRGKHSLPAFFELVEFEICQQLQVSGQQQLSPLLASNLSRKQRNMKINLPSPTERQHVRVISMSNLQSGSPRFDLFRQLPGFVLGGPLEFRYYAMFINNQLVASCQQRFLILVCYTQIICFQLSLFECSVCKQAAQLSTLPLKYKNHAFTISETTCFMEMKPSPYLKTILK